MLGAGVEGARLARLKGPGLDAIVARAIAVIVGRVSI